MGRDAVFISQYFPPFSAVASQRALRIARVLLSNFDHVYVVTLPTYNLPGEYIDPEYARDILSNPRLRVVRVPPQLAGYGFVKEPRSAHRLLGAMMTRMLCSSGSDWLIPLSKALKSIHEKANLRLVITTGGPFIPFWVVTNFAKKAKVPCIVDYRDLWSGNPRAPYPSLFRLLVKYTVERYVNGRCTVITTVSEGCRRSLISDGTRCVVKTLLNTPDSSYLAWFSDQAESFTRSKFDSVCLNIVLTGTVYRECTCRLLVEAVSRLPPAAQHKIKLHYFGPSSELVKRDFLKMKSLSNLIDHGLVSKGDAITAVKSADILLSLVCDRKNCEDVAMSGVMTTKVFDYFLSGKPVLNIGPCNGDLNGFAREVGYVEFHSFSYSEVSWLSKFLFDAVLDLAKFRRRRSRVVMPDFGQAFQQILDDVQD